MYIWICSYVEDGLDYGLPVSEVQGYEFVSTENADFSNIDSRTRKFLLLIQINQPTRCNNFSSFLFDVYVQLNMFRASPRPSSGAQQLQ